jgi:hypothetical protein
MRVYGVYPPTEGLVAILQVDLSVMSLLDLAMRSSQLFFKI